MKKKVFVVIPIAAMLILTGCIGKKATGKTVVMSLKELSEDFNYTMNQTTFHYVAFFKSLDPGDTVIIKDNISEKRVSGNMTLLLLSSLPDGGFYFDANLTNFNEGDEIEIELHIGSDSFTQQNGQQIWTIDTEVLEEGWDFDRHTTKPLPADTVKHIQS